MKWQPKLAPITEDRNWRNVDQLNDKDIKDGERLYLKLGDELVIRTVKLKRWTVKTNDMGAPWDEVHQEAGFEIVHDGITFWGRIPLGTMAARVSDQIGKVDRL